MYARKRSKGQQLICSQTWTEIYNVLYQRKGDVDMLNAVKSVLADVLSVRLCQSKERTEIVKLSTLNHCMYSNSNKYMFYSTGLQMVWISTVDAHKGTVP